MTVFGQLVIGPPGSGKTTYCSGLSHFLKSIGRPVAIVNLDPANETMPYTPDIDVAELISLEDVVEEFNLGPNGALMYCLEYLEKNLDWLNDKISQFKGHYFIFDCPGQVELYTHHKSMKNIVKQFGKWDYRVAVAHLVDSHYCSDPFKYISVLLLSLQTMLRLELPHVNILSKFDLMEQFGELAFAEDFYTDVLDLDYLVEVLSEGSVGGKWVKLNKAICELVTEFDLVNFLPLCIEDKESIYKVIKTLDKANGYFYGDYEPKEEYMLPPELVTDDTYPDALEIQEKFDELSMKVVAESKGT